MQNVRDNVATEESGGAQRARGRPRQLDEQVRRQRLIAAAEHVFVERGYGAARMDGVARRAGMSKKTIYQLFATKQELFAAVIDSRRAELAAVIERESASESSRPDDVLRRLVRKIARFVLAPRQAALYRLAVAESQRAPKLANAFHKEGSSKACSPLTEWLALQHERGALWVPDPPAAAKMLFAMALGELQMRALMGELREPDAATIDRKVDEAIDLFLDGTRPRSASESSRRVPLSG